MVKFWWRWKNLDEKYSLSDFSAEAKAQEEKDCNLFKEKAGKLLDKYSL